MKMTILEKIVAIVLVLVEIWIGVKTNLGLPPVTEYSHFIISNAILLLIYAGMVVFFVIFTSFLWRKKL